MTTMVTDPIVTQFDNHVNDNESAEDTLASKNHRMVEGVVVWAKVDGFPMWPAVIRRRSRILSALTDEEQQSLPPSGIHNRLVEFFNDDNRIAVVHLNNLDLFTADVHHLSRAGSALRTTISEACDEAETFIRVCGQAYQQQAICEDPHLEEPKATPQLVALGPHSDSDSSDDDLDVPLAEVHYANNSRTPMERRRRLPPPSESSTPQRPKSRVIPGTGDNNIEINNTLPISSPQVDGSSKRQSSPLRLGISENDVCGPTPEGHPPWTTPLSVINNTSPQGNGTQSLASGAESTPAEGNSTSLPMKLRLRGVSSEKGSSSRKRRRVPLTPKRRDDDEAGDHQFRERVSRVNRIVDDDDDSDSEDESMLHGQLSNGVRSHRRENGANGLNQITKQSKRSREIDLSDCQEDIDFVNEQAEMVTEFAKRLSRLSRKYEKLVEKTKTMKVHEAELEEVKENVRMRKEALAVQKKEMERSLMTLDETRNEEKALAEEVERQKSMLEKYKADLDFCKQTTEKEKEASQKYTEEARLQKEIADNQRMEAEKQIVAYQKMQRRMEELQNEVCRLRDERRSIKRGVLTGSGTLTPQPSAPVRQSIPEVVDVDKADHVSVSTASKGQDGNGTVDERVGSVTQVRKGDKMYTEVIVASGGAVIPSAGSLKDRASNRTMQEVVIPKGGAVTGDMGSVTEVVEAQGGRLRTGSGSEEGKDKKRG